MGVARKTKQQRAEERAKRGRLADLRLAPRTKCRYARQILAFIAFCEDLPGGIPDRQGAYDELVCTFIEGCYDEGMPRGSCGDLLSALHHHVPVLHGQLRTAWRLMDTWSRHELPDRALAIDETMAEGLAGALLLRKRASIALGVVLGFFALLRTQELLCLRWGRILVDLQTGVIILNLGFSKSGQRRGAEEGVRVDCMPLAWALEAARPAGEPGAALIEHSPARFRQYFAEAVRDTGLDHLPVRPYSLRRGGASHLFRQSGSYSLVTERGRWARLETSRIYISEAAAQTASIRLPTRAQATLSAHRRRWLKFVEGFETV